MLTDPQLEELRRLMKTVDDAQANLTTAKAALQAYVHTLGTGDALPVAEVAARATDALGAAPASNQNTQDNVYYYIARHPSTTRAAVRKAFNTNNTYYTVRKLIAKGRVIETKSGKLRAMELR